VKIFGPIPEWRVTLYSFLASSSIMFSVLSFSESGKPWWAVALFCLVAAAMIFINGHLRGYARGAMVTREVYCERVDAMAAANKAFCEKYEARVNELIAELDYWKKAVGEGEEWKRQRPPHPEDR
jgi:hypothetical protein